MNNDTIQENATHENTLPPSAAPDEGEFTVCAVRGGGEGAMQRAVLVVAYTRPSWKEYETRLSHPCVFLDGENLIPEVGDYVAALTPIMVEALCLWNGTKPPFEERIEFVPSAAALAHLNTITSRLRLSADIPDDPLLRRFENQDLELDPAEKEIRQEIAQSFLDLARRIVRIVAESDERIYALRRLLEAKEAALRAALSG